MPLASPYPPSDADTPLMRYEALVAAGRVADDPAQREVLGHLQKLLKQWRPEPTKKTATIGGLFKKSAPAAPSVQGVYLWGNVGRGKSMLMELFFESAPIVEKRRVHFHAFMQETHAALHRLRQDSQRDKNTGDPVARLTQDIAAHISLLCFDELQAQDVADATLLFRLFDGLFAAGVTIVSTSNHPPASLYTGGVQAERFARFIALLEGKMQVLSLSSADDYRRLQATATQKTYFYPLGPAAAAFLADTLRRIAPGPTPRKASIEVHGRTLTFELYGDDIGEFTFKQLCETPAGAADYLAIAARLGTVIISGIPVLSPEKRNEAKRLVMLVDACYERKTRLICTAEAPAEALYAQGDGSFEFKRTVSRLAEMQSAAYLRAHE